MCVGARDVGVGIRGVNNASDVDVGILDGVEVD